jgi:hypothetical protein
MLVRSPKSEDSFTSPRRYGMKPAGYDKLFSFGEEYVGVDDETDDLSTGENGTEGHPDDER